MVVQVSLPLSIIKREYTHVAQMPSSYQVVPSCNLAADRVGYCYRSCEYCTFAVFWLLLMVHRQEFFLCVSGAAQSLVDIL